MLAKLLLFTCFLLSSVLQAQLNLSNGLIAYYPFNGNANDQSGNNNNPIFNNTILVSDQQGNKKSACYFNGKDNYIRIRNNKDLTTTEMTIVAMVKPMGFYKGNCYNNSIVDKGSSDYSRGGYSLRFTAGEYTNGDCSDPAYDHQNFVGMTYNNGGATSKDLYVTLNNWYCVIFSFSRESSNMYVNGRLISSLKHTRPIGQNNEDIFIGKKDNAQFPYWFNGIVDEVRFYNRPLTKDEIRTLCDVKLNKNKPEIICEGNNIIPAKFDYSISNCTTASFNLSTTKTKDLTSIKWLFGDGSTSNKPAAVHTYKKYGTYKVKVITTSKTGCTDTVTRQLQLQELQADFTMTEKGSPGELLFKVKNNKAAYTWAFDEEDIIKNESVVNKQYLQSGNYTIALFAKNNNGCTDTVSKKIIIALPEPITATVRITPEETTPALLPTVNNQLDKRNKDVIRTISLEQDSIGIALYDNGIIDGDSITLLFNNEIVVAKQLLKSNPLKMWLRIDPSKTNNELVMYAENLGSIPPNTALLIITDGDKKYEVNISSNKASNGTVSFIPKPITITAQ